MSRTLRIPDEAELPSGTVRDFVELLFYFYRTARRPTLRAISEWIRKNDLPGTASTETIRRMLRGTTVPSHWETVEAVLDALSAMSGRTPNVSLRWDGRPGTRSSHLERLWHRALDNPGLYYGEPEPEPEPDPEKLSRPVDQDLFATAVF